jgi:Dimerisation domain
MADAARPRPIEDVREISAITYGFMASKALFAALEFDLFTHIAQGADSNGALGVATGIAENRLVTLLAALKSLGLVSEAGGRLSKAPATGALSRRRRARRFPRLRPTRERRVRLREFPLSERGFARRADFPGQRIL